MSNISASAGTFEGKMQVITDYLKNKVVDPAEQEKQRILGEAETEKKRIIEAAKKEAETIISDAKAEASRQESTLQSALRIAGKQAIGTLKQTLESEILKQSVEQPVKSVLSSEELVKQFVKEAIDMFMQKESGNAELVLSDDLKAGLSDYIKNEIVSKSGGKVSLSSEKVPTGFSVVLSDKKLMYDFSQESMVELLAEYLRPELRTYLFEK